MFTFLGPCPPVCLFVKMFAFWKKCLPFVWFFEKVFAFLRGAKAINFFFFLRRNFAVHESGDDLFTFPHTGTV